VLSFLDAKEAVRYQTLSKKLYSYHVPFIIRTVNCFGKEILSNSQMRLLKSQLEKDKSLRMLYVGSQFEFSSQKFHELCDNKGPTISVCKSEAGHIFGFYTSVPWKSKGGYVCYQGKAFLFRLEGHDKVVKIR
jgi:hypothetical protein